jgi:hypothetical protein
MTADAPAVAASADKSTIVGEVQEAGVVSSVSYTPVADVTGANTETRTLTLVNKGSNGNGTTVIATLALTSGVNMSDFDEKALTLSVVDGATTVAADDVLAFVSTHSGSTGLADPGGSVKVEIARD